MNIIPLAAALPLLAQAIAAKLEHGTLAGLEFTPDQPQFLRLVSKAGEIRFLKEDNAEIQVGGTTMFLDTGHGEAPIPVTLLVAMAMPKPKTYGIKEKPNPRGGGRRNLFVAYCLASRRVISTRADEAQARSEAEAEGYLPSTPLPAISS